MQKQHLYLVRYADDLVILGKNKTAIHQAQELSANILRQLSLELHPQKTRVTHFKEGFQFVGWFFVRDEMYELK